MFGKEINIAGERISGAFALQRHLSPIFEELGFVYGTVWENLRGKEKERVSVTLGINLGTTVIFNPTPDHDASLRVGDTGYITSLTEELLTLANIYRLIFAPTRDKYEGMITGRLSENIDLSSIPVIYPYKRNFLNPVKSYEETVHDYARAIYTLKQRRMSVTG